MTTTKKNNNNNKNSITVRLSYRTAKTKKIYDKKWQQKKKKEMNKWMTQIKQKQGGTELQDIFLLSSIWFIHYTVYYI